MFFKILTVCLDHVFHFHQFLYFQLEKPKESQRKRYCFFVTDHASLLLIFTSLAQRCLKIDCRAQKGRFVPNDLKFFSLRCKNSLIVLSAISLLQKNRFLLAAVVRDNAIYCPSRSKNRVFRNRTREKKQTVSLFFILKI